MIFLASYGSFGGGSIGNMLAQWEAAGVFTYVLPFLLIFAIVFSILSFINVFKDNKAVNAVIALAVSLLALQFQIVPIFFAEIFPRLGIGLSILLVVVILGGMFIDPSNQENGWIKWVLIAITVAIIIVVVGGSLGGIGFGGGFGGLNFLYGLPWGMIIIGLIVIAAFIWIIKSTNTDPKKRV